MLISTFRLLASEHRLRKTYLHQINREAHGGSDEEDRSLRRDSSASMLVWRSVMDPCNAKPRAQKPFGQKVCLPTRQEQ